MNSIRCPQCNFLSFATATECKRCKFEFQAAQSNSDRYQSNHSEEEHFSDFGKAQTRTQADNAYNSHEPNNYQNFNHAVGQTGNNYNYQGAPRYQTHSQKPKIKLAVISMILGILSFPGFSLIIGIILSLILANIFGATGAIIGVLLPLAAIPGGLISGIVSLVRARKNPLEYGGKGFAIAGIVLSGMFLLVFPLIAAIAIPNVLAARRAANESAAIRVINQIANAESAIPRKYSVSPKGNGMTGEFNCEDLKSLAAKGAIDPVLGSGTHFGYDFTVKMIPNGCEILASPTATEGMSATGNRTFFASSYENWEIKASTNKGKPADKTDQPINADYSRP